MITAQLDAAPRWEVAHVFPLPHTPGAVASVRGCVRAVLRAWGVAAETTEDVLLVTSELLTNALVHALPPVTLTLSRSLSDRCTGVRVEVTDMAAPSPSVRPAEDPDEHGRGLGIVAALSERCGVRLHPAGTGRWAELRTPEDAAVPTGPEGDPAGPAGNEGARGGRPAAGLTRAMRVGHRPHGAARRTRAAGA